MGRETALTRESTAAISAEGPEKAVEEKLRPSRLQNVIGQERVVERLQILLDASKQKKDALPHILLDGPPGIGKTTLANVLPKELGVELVLTSGPALAKPNDVMPYLTNLTEHAVLFIDEIHRLPRVVEEFIYPAMEDFRVDVVIGDGIGAKTMNIQLKKFTLIGATTRSGMLSSPLRDRFIVREHLDFYSDDELTTLVKINSKKLNVQMDHPTAYELARRSRGTPRIANSHLHWVQNYSISRCNGEMSLDVMEKALRMQEVDHHGLDRQDRRYLDTLLRVFSGGPAGVEALAATMNVSSDTLSDEVEPFLLRREFIIRTPRGRQATPLAYDHMKAFSNTDIKQQNKLF